MRILVISDIHSNYPALEAVLSSAEKYDSIWCLGDLVGYGPFPNECVERIASLPNLTCILGNHDAAVIDSRNIDKFNDEAGTAIYWTKRVISQTNLDYLSKLEEKAIVEDVLLVHGSPRIPTWEYVIDRLTAMINFAYFDTKIALIGHSHLPLSFEEQQGDLPIKQTLLYPDQITKITSKCLLNPGSVGQPRDHDPRASYGILDTVNLTWEIFRVPYNTEITQNALKKVGLPVKLGVRLVEGW